MVERITNITSLSGLARQRVAEAGYNPITGERERGVTRKVSDYKTYEERRAEEETKRQAERAAEAEAQRIAAEAKRTRIISAVTQSPDSFVKRLIPPKIPQIGAQKPKTTSLKQEFIQAIKPSKADVALFGATLLTPFPGDEPAAAGIIAARKAKKVVKVGYKAAKVGYTAFKGTRAGILTEGVIASLLLGKAGVEVAKKVGKETASEEQRRIIESPDFSGAVSAGFRAEQQALSKQSSFGIPGTSKGVSLKSIGFQISPFLSGNKKAYREGAEQYYKDLGYSSAEAQKRAEVVLRERKVRASGELASFLTISGTAERTGQKLLTKEFSVLGKKGVEVAEKEAGGLFFKKAFKAIAPAGFVEGFSQEIAQQQARQQQKDIKAAAVMGGYGFLSAGVLGGTIAGLRIPKPKTSKIIELGTYISDPFEKPGDILADIYGIGKRSITGEELPIPQVYRKFAKPRDSVVFGKSPIVETPGIITPTPSKTPTGVITPTKTEKPSDIFSFEKPPKSQIMTPQKEEPLLNWDNLFRRSRTKKTGGYKLPVLSISPTAVKTPVQTPTKTPTPTSIISNIFGTPTPSPTPTPSKTPTPIDIFSPTKTPTQTITGTPTPTFTPVSIPILTPIMRAPPPIPFGSGFDFGGSIFGTRKGKRKTYIDELAAAQKAFFALSGMGYYAPKQKKRSSSKKKRRRKR